MDKLSTNEKSVKSFTWKKIKDFNYKGGTVDLTRVEKSEVVKDWRTLKGSLAPEGERDGEVQKDLKTVDRRGRTRNSQGLERLNSVVTESHNTQGIGTSTKKSWL